MTQIQLTDFVAHVAQTLADETELSYRLTCPNPDCRGDQFILSKANGSGRCQVEDKNYSLWAIGQLVGMDNHGLYGVFYGKAIRKPCRHGRRHRSRQYTGSTGN